MLTLAFDTALPTATVALVEEEHVLGEAKGLARSVLAMAHILLEDAGLTASSINRVVVGAGPGSFTGIRIGLALARGLARGLDIPVAGVSTLACLSHGAPGALPIIDARRGEIFVADPEPRAVAPTELELAPGQLCVGNGAVRYRALFEQAGADIPPDSSHLHQPEARHHAALAKAFGSAELIEPMYLRLPDAKVRAA